MEIKNLSMIADMQCGLVLNRKEARIGEPVKKQYKQLNLRSLDENGRLNMGELDNYDSVEELDKPILTQKKDIILRLFAPPLPIIIYSNEVGFVIPSQLAVIRVKDDVTVLSEYLRWYLSSTDVTNRLLLSDASQLQRSIKISALATLQVPIPPLAKQRLIVQIHDTSIKREHLYKELMEQEKLYVNGLLKKTIGGMSK